MNRMSERNTFQIAHAPTHENKFQQTQHATILHLFAGQLSKYEHLHANNN